MAKTDPHVGIKDKAGFVSGLKNKQANPTSDITAAIRRVAQWAASGHYPRGLNYDDLKWLYDKMVAELKRRDPKSKAGGNFPAEGSGRSAFSPAETRCHQLDVVLAAAREAVQAAGGEKDNLPQHKAKPTPQDAEVSSAVMKACAAVDDAIKAQTSDPDNGKDPDDERVMSALKSAESSLKDAQAAQKKDSADDSRMKVPARVSVPSASPVHERHVVTLSTVELRLGVETDTNLAHFEGYASRTAIPYDVTDYIGTYRETIAPGAFGKTLQEQRNVPLLVNHDGMPIATTGSRTSVLTEDGNGLLNTATFDRRQSLANDVCVSLERGDLSKMSFAFRAIRQDWSADYADRSVTEVALLDTSIVTSPASPTTSAGLRSALVEAIGREGRTIALDVLADPSAEVIDRAVAVFHSASDVMSRGVYRSFGQARLALVASDLVEMRKGKKLSAASQSLLTKALAALGEAQGHLNTLQDVDNSNDNNDGTLDDDRSTPRSRLSLKQAQAFALSLRNK